MSKKKIARLLIRLYEIQKIYGRINESDLIRIARENKINLYGLIEKKENKKNKILNRERRRWRRPHQRKKRQKQKKEN